MNDISKYDQAGTEDEPSGKAECDTLTRAGQPAACFRGRRKRGAHYYSKCGGGCFRSFCPLKEKKNSWREILSLEKLERCLTSWLSIWKWKSISWLISDFKCLQPTDFFSLPVRGSWLVIAFKWMTIKWLFKVLMVVFISETSSDAAPPHTLPTALINRPLVHT